MLLHTLNASPASPAFENCLALLARGDALLLLGDGVYAALPNTAPRERLESSGAQVYVLDADARAAGVVVEGGKIGLIDMPGFVALTERFERQMAWY